MKVLNGTVLLAVSYDLISKHRDKVREDSAKAKKVHLKCKKSLSLGNIDEFEFEEDLCETLKYQSAFET
jgi:hypothetical protein